METNRPGPVGRFLRRAAILIVLLAVAFGAGWLLAHSGQRMAEQRAADARVRVPLLEARGMLLQAQLDVQASNFGDAGRHVEDARNALQEATAAASDGNVRTHLGQAVASATEAQSRVGQLDRGAGAAAAAATAAIDAAVASLPAVPSQP